METKEEKPEIKNEPKEEEEGGVNGTSVSTSPTQNRKKSEDLVSIKLARSLSND
jgi:hypothetical protein